MINLSYIPFPDHSRVWIYQADQKLSADQQEILMNRGGEFVNQWQAHGHDLTAGFFVVLDHFIMIVVDEQMESASGCSIDKSVKLMLDLQQELGVSFTNRLISALYISNEVILYPYNDVKTGLEAGKINGDTLVFDNTITNLNLLKNSWLKPLKQTWLKKLLASQNV